jgi:hypothetical protein
MAAEHRLQLHPPAQPSYIHSPMFPQMIAGMRERE